MAKAYASAILEAPVEAVWPLLRDFNGLPNWLPAIASSRIEDGSAADRVGCVRALDLHGGGFCSERLLALDDSRYRVSYAFVQPAFPIRDYTSNLELIPITSSDQTYVQWTGTFEEAPDDAGKWAKVIKEDIYASGLASLAAKVKGATGGGPRWDGWRPAKVFCSSVIHGSVDAVWARIRDFAGMGGWHDAISEMHMLSGVPADKVSGVREFTMNGGKLHERLTFLSDAEHAFRYTIEQSPMPWLNYHAGVRLHPVNDRGHTVAVWTADWVAAPNDDAVLIPDIHANVFQHAFDTLNARYFPG